jgi:hypothetical protein
MDVWLHYYAGTGGSDKMDKSRQANGIAPNFVHSMDAAHLMKTIIKAKDKHDIEDFSVVHDSFGTHACDIDNRHKYGIEPEYYYEMLASQNNKCAICSISVEEYKLDSKFCVDHDHSTGEVRGLLCRQCNTGIGLLKDSPILCYTAYQYLELHKGRTI